MDFVELMRNVILVLCAMAIVLSPQDVFAKRKRAKVAKHRPHPVAVEKPPPAPAPAVANADEPAAIVVHIESNKPGYVAGEEVAFAVRVEESCNLTLISIDGDGFATVLFPNDFERENQIEAGPTISVPRDGAPYRLRLAKPGIETVLGICTKTAKRPLGIGHDFDRHRFTIIGEWDSFTSSAEARESELHRYVQEENRRRRQKRGEPPAIVLGAPPSFREAEGRALLLLPVSDAVSSSRVQGP